MEKDTVNTWLSVFGVTSFVFGILIILATGAGILALSVLTTIMSSHPRADILIALIGVLGIAMGALYIAAGIGVQKRTSWARVIGVITSILSLFSFPLGTAYGILGIWLLATEKRAITQFPK